MRTREDIFIMLESSGRDLSEADLLTALGAVHFDLQCRVSKRPVTSKGLRDALEVIQKQIEVLEGLIKPLK